MEDPNWEFGTVRGAPAAASSGGGDAAAAAAPKKEDKVRPRDLFANRISLQ